MHKKAVKDSYIVSANLTNQKHVFSSVSNLAGRGRGNQPGNEGEGAAVPPIIL
jgi:hypothetical protein